MRSDKDILHVCELICRILEGHAAPREIQILEGRVHREPEVVKLYTQIADTHAQLTCPGQSMRIFFISNISNDPILDMKLWELLLEEEKTAPTIEVEPPSQPKPPLIHKVERKKTAYKLDKFSIATFTATAAAILFFVLFARFTHPRAGVPVATLMGSIDAKWADTNGALQTGARLKTGSGNYQLQKGFAKLLFDNQTWITLEGPVEFQIMTDDQIRLNYGRLYAIVPPQAYGFQVNTPTAKIIDLGTEFGVQYDQDGNTELHVIKGKTNLVSGIGGSQINMVVGAGAAKRLDVTTGQLVEISCADDLFVRRIDSQTKVVWRSPGPVPAFDVTFELVDRFEGAGPLVHNRRPETTLGGIWATEPNNTGNCQIDQVDGSDVLQLQNNTSGDGRGVKIYGLNRPVNPGGKGVLFFRFKIGGVENAAVEFYLGLYPDSRSGTPFDMYAAGQTGIAAGFGIAGAAVPKLHGKVDIITTDRRVLAAAGIRRGQWYSAWLVADNAAKTLDLYLAEADGPSGPPTLPLISDRVAAGIPFGAAAHQPLTGAKFVIPRRESQTPKLWIDEVHWGLLNDRRP